MLLYNASVSTNMDGCDDKYQIQYKKKYNVFFQLHILDTFNFVYYLLIFLDVGLENIRKMQIFLKVIFKKQNKKHNRECLIPILEHNI